ncbi:MAG: prepilin peptidase, partial [Candidatus Omnitrophica bacterium]|nr:prepilin peptidase [Candidatus Omnitrophota bacterium]
MIFETALAVILGLCVGSFLNVCIYRLPKELSLVKPGSFCPHCKGAVLWHDNIPVLSFLLLRGKCRSCRASISVRYPLVEIISAVLFGVLYARFGATLVFAQYLFFFLLLLVVSCIDIDYHAIPAYLCFIGIAVGLGFSVWQTVVYTKTTFFNLGQLPLVRSFRGLIFGFGFTYLFKFCGDIFISLYLALRKKESIEGEKESLGLGDVDFMGMVGVFLGIKATVLTFFLAPFFAMLIQLAISRKREFLAD